MLVTYLEFIAACAILGYCTYTDIKHREISNIACILLFCVWLASNIYLVIVRNFDIVNVGFQILEGIVVLSVMLLVSYLFEKFTKKPSLGGGDIKLIAVCCLFFNTKAFLEFVFLACIIGVGSSVLDKDRESGFPFAPAIAVAFVFVFIKSNILTLY